MGKGSFVGRLSLGSIIRSGSTVHTAYLGFNCDHRLAGKINTCGIQNCILLQDAGLREVVAKWLQHSNTDLPGKMCTTT